MKRLIGTILAVVLLAGGLGGFVYAAGPHVPLTGQKLVGMGRLGSESVGTSGVTYRSRFGFTNPDDVGEITIRRISIISGNGTVIYEGPLRRQKHAVDLLTGKDEVIDDSPWMSPMTPHKARSIILWTYFPDTGDPAHTWMSKNEAIGQNRKGYTVEIFYDTEKKGLPLIGHSNTRRRAVSVASGDVSESGFLTQMFNMKQRLKP